MIHSYQEGIITRNIVCSSHSFLFALIMFSINRTNSKDKANKSIRAIKVLQTSAKCPERLNNVKYHCLNSFILQNYCLRMESIFVLKPFKLMII